MSASITANPLFAPLFADPEVSHLFQADLTLHRMIAFEVALTKGLKTAGLARVSEANLALEAMETFVPDVEKIGLATAIDGLPVPELIRQIKTHAGPTASAAIHTGSTSQDLMDTVLAMALRDLSDILAKRITQLITDLEQLRIGHGQNPLMGRTRMQAALPIQVADRIANWIAPLSRSLDRLEEIRPRVEILQFGGPVGNRAGFQGKGDQIAAQMAQDFALSNPAISWHTMRDGLVEYAGWLSRVSGAVGKIGQDICLMAQQGIDEVSLTGGGKSSAMAHKQNPILAETLVTLARYNAVLVSGMHQTILHEQERSGTAWALEWICLPQMAETTGKSLLLTQQLTGQIVSMGSTGQA